MEQSLSSDNEFKSIKLNSDSIGLIKMLDYMCYNYHSHEYPPLGAWEVMDCLGDSRQPYGVSEVKHLETFKTIVEVCKASGVTFSLMYTVNVDTAMKVIFKESKILVNG